MIIKWIAALRRSFTATRAAIHEAQNLYHLATDIAPALQWIGNLA